MEYPFTQKWRGLRTIQKFVKEAIENNFSTAVATRECSDARARSNVGMGENAILRFDEPFDAVEIDAQRIDAEFCVTFFTPEGTEQRLSLERLWILAAVCRSNSCILAIKVVYANAVTANDVVSLIRLAVASTWEPRNLSIPGLTYLREGGMPSGVIPEAAGAIWGVLFLDGALAHLADAIQQEVRGLLGFAINYGAVGRFERRPNVERTFEEITKSLFQRLPSTTGSRPHLGREPKAREKAIQFDINVNDVEELLDVTATSHNGFPSSGLSNMSALDHVRFHITGDWPRTLVRRLPECSAERAKFFTLRLKKKVRGNTKSGTRPYVELDGARYTNPILAEAANLIGTDIFVDVDENDYRQIKAYLANGSEIGFLIAQGRWGETKHDRKTRKAINSLRNQRMLVMTSMDDPVQVYLKYLAEKRASNKAAKVSIPPKRATEALRVAKNAGNQNVVMSTPKEPTTTITPPRLSDVRTVEPASSTTKLLLLKIGNRR